MDFDSIVSLLILFFFFVLPTIFKQLKAKKKSTEKKSLFGKIGEQINLFLKEIEEQNRQNREQSDSAADIWESFAREDEAYEYQEDDPYYTDEVPGQKFEGQAEEPEKHPGLAAFEEPAREPEPVKIKETASPLLHSDSKPVHASARAFRASSLQNAVIWSEILGKPVAFKEE